MPYPPPHTQGTDPTRNPEHKLLLDDQKITIMETVLSLPPQYAQAIIMRYYNNMGIDEISEAMDCSRSTTKRRIKKAQELLESLLENQKGGIGLD